MKLNCVLSDIDRISFSLTLVDSLIVPLELIGVCVLGVPGSGLDTNESAAGIVSRSKVSYSRFLQVGGFFPFFSRVSFCFVLTCFSLLGVNGKLLPRCWSSRRS
jgi:hypothetical protein